MGLSSSRAWGFGVAGFGSMTVGFRAYALGLRVSGSGCCSGLIGFALSLV